MAVQPDATHPNRRRGRPILVVEDDPEVRVLVSEYLSDAGFRSVSAADGGEALRRLDEGPPPALILLDIQMPGMDGPSFARELRTRLSRVPIVVITALARPDREADRCNADGYLAKPFDESSLLRLVRRFAR